MINDTWNDAWQDRYMTWHNTSKLLLVIGQSVLLMVVTSATRSQKMSKVHMKWDHRMTNFQIKKFPIIQTKEMCDKCGKAFSNLWKHVCKCKGQNCVPLTTPVKPEQEQVPLAFNSGGKGPTKSSKPGVTNRLGLRAQRQVTRMNSSTSATSGSQPLRVLYWNLNLFLNL